MTLPDVRAVLFDAGGVLMIPDPDEFRKATAPLGLRPDDETCHRAHYAGMREVDRLGEADWPAIDRVVARHLGVPEDELDTIGTAISEVYLGTGWVPVAGAAEAVSRVAGAGYALAVVSNATGTVEQQLATHQICSVDGHTCTRVAVVVDSHIVGVEKPDPAIFAIALAEIGIKPEQCVYIGDSVHFDVQGARSAGLFPYHLDPFSLCDTDDHPHLRSLDELPAALRTG